MIKSRKVHETESKNMEKVHKAFDNSTGKYMICISL